MAREDEPPGADLGAPTTCSACCRASITLSSHHDCHTPTRPQILRRFSSRCLALPDTKAVQNRLTTGDVHQITVLDVAGWVLDSLLEQPASLVISESEVRFLRDCLLADRASLSLPIPLLQSWPWQQRASGPGQGLFLGQGGPGLGLGCGAGLQVRAPSACPPNGQRAMAAAASAPQIGPHGASGRLSLQLLCRAPTLTPGLSAADVQLERLEEQPQQTSASCCIGRRESANSESAMTLLHSVQSTEEADFQRAVDVMMSCRELWDKDVEELRSLTSAGLAAGEEASDEDPHVPVEEAELTYPMELLPTVVKRLNAVLRQPFDDWSIDIFALAELTHNQPLRFVGWEAIQRAGLLGELPLSASKVLVFLESIEAMYGSRYHVLYHNSLHASDVTQLTHCLLSPPMGLRRFFSQLERLVLLIGAVVHDVGHLGKTAAFHHSVMDELALTYNDRSVLENYHLALTFKLLVRSQAANILDSFESDATKAFRRQIVNAVLATDMSTHFTLVSTCKQLAESLGTSREAWRDEALAIGSLQALVLHKADISNPTKRADLSDRWVSLTLSEFYRQGDEEARLGLTVSPLCDRNTTSMCSSQVGFTSFIYEPTLAVVAKVSPAVGELLGKVLEANLELWRDRQKAEEADLAAAAEAAEVAAATQAAVASRRD